MALKSPLFCASIYVTGSCTIRCVGSVSGSFTVTIPEGRFWCDPLAFAAAGVTGGFSSTEALANFMSTFDNTVAGAFGSYTTIPTPGDPQQTSYWTGINDVSETVQILPNDALTSDEGRRFLTFLGFDRRQATGASNSHVAPGYAAAWRPSRYEAGDLDDTRRTFSAVAEMSGAVAVTSMADDLLGRLVVLRGIPGASVKRRAGLAQLTYCSWESNLHPWVGARGGLLRYYEDVGATNNTVLTAPCGINDLTITVPSSAGMTFKNLCVDGEWMVATNAPTGTTVNVWRDQPVAHPFQAPVSSSFCGTFALAGAGGNINARGCNPVRRGGENQDRWDMEIALVRAAWGT